MDEVLLRPLTPANRAAAEALRVAPEQERFVSSVTDSLRQVAEHPNARAECWVICAGDTPVGFAVTCDEVDGAEYVPQYLWKLLVDARHQRRGHGRAALALIAERFAGREALTTSAVPGPGSPIGFYERCGFERTGGLREGEVVLRLALRPSAR